MYQPRSSPYGSVYTIPTQYIDGIANRVYQEQKLREQQKLQQDKALDDEFAKNVAGVKSVDIPDITKAYSEYKQAHINLQKKGQKATPQDQMDVMIKKANAFSEIAASKEDKEYWGMRAKDGKNNKRYNPNYQTIISDGLNTRTKDRNRDADDDNLLAKYAMPDISKEILNATGKAEDFDVFVGADDKDPLKDKYDRVKKINPPNTFYNNLFTGLGTRADRENFTRFVLDNSTDDEKQKLRTEFELKIQDPRFKALYGEVKPFPSSAANTELGQAVALKTMEVYSQLPIVGEEVKVLNIDRNKERGVTDKIDAEGRANKEYDRRQKVSDGYIKGRMKLRAELGLNPPTISQYVTFDQTGEEQDVPIELPNGVWGSKEGKISNGIVYDADGKPLQAGEIDIKGDKLPSTVVAVLKNAKIIDPKYQKAPDVKAIVVNGEIRAIKTKNGDVSRQQMLEFQQSYDKERKGEGLFRSENKPQKGNTTPKGKTETKPKKDPLGLGF